MRKLNLYHLHRNIYGVTKSVGSFLAEAAQVCLEQNGYQSGVIVNVSGIYTEKIVLEWDRTINWETLLSWKDMKETVEYGATAVTLSLLGLLTGYDYAKRLTQADTDDFVMFKRGVLQSSPTYIEITGIYQNSSAKALEFRILNKRKQLKKR